MNRRARPLLVLLLIAPGPAAGAARAADPATAASPALGVDVFTSSDADHTDVRRIGVDLDWRHAGPAAYQGLRLERAVFRSPGQTAAKDLRLYYRFASRHAAWSWQGQAGTDGETVLGALSVHNESRFRQEYFLEREIVETSRGVRGGVYYTFAGGALDLPFGAADNATVVVALQDFTGDDLRTHLRASYVHVLNEDWGLTAQLRGRYFHSSHPGEVDYFSPRNFVQLTPTLQLRRRAGGWRYLAAEGLGAQRQTGGGWRPARALNAQVTSPPAKSGWGLEATFAYSNTPVSAGYTYDYRQVTLGLRRMF